MMDTKLTAPSAVPGAPCSSVRAPTVPGEAGPNFLLLLLKEPHTPPTWEAGAEGCASGIGAEGYTKAIEAFCPHSHHSAIPSVLK